jgi:hypothetical protein
LKIKPYSIRINHGIKVAKWAGTGGEVEKAKEADH